MDAMIDIETLSKENNAVVLSVGVVVFDPSGADDLKCDDPDFVDQYYWELAVLPQIMKGRHICPETVGWWRSQDIPPPEGAFSPEYMLVALAKAFAVNSVNNVWFKGPQFDEVKLQSIGADFSVDLPWKYSAVRDSRTLCAFAKRNRSGGSFQPHNALDDCKIQALDVQHAFKALGLPLETRKD